jgi:AbiV family abortive infection protein
VDVAVLKARRNQQATYAVAAARNAAALLGSAEVLASAGRFAPAYSLAAFSVEECGKAAGLAALAALPRTKRVRAALGRLAGWHQLKMIGGLMTSVITSEEPGGAAKLARMTATQAAEIVNYLAVPAEEADRLKRRGLYVDMDRNGRVSEPSEITREDLSEQLARTQKAVSSVAILLTPEGHERLEHPRAEMITLASGVVDAVSEAGGRRTPEDAVGVLLEAVRRLH